MSEKVNCTIFEIVDVENLYLYVTIIALRGAVTKI